ncbi:hypothetical protein GCM10020218_086720 [Dactylosporangium vinaceum]
MILTAMGVLVESGLGYSPPPGRYAAADIVVARPEITITTRDPRRLATAQHGRAAGGRDRPGVLWPGRWRGVAGVASVVVDDAVPVAVGGRPGRGARLEQCGAHAVHPGAWH